MKIFNSILELATFFDTDLKCRQYLASKVWQDSKPVCPHCKHEEVYHFSDGKRYKCKECKKQFTVTVGTIFEGSHIPLQKWFMAGYLISAHKKGISSLQLSRDLNITQKSAWYMLHRYRFAIRTQSFLAPLDKTVEIDECFVGGKERFKHKSKRGLIEKTPVFGMVERGGEVRAEVVPNLLKKTVTPIIYKHISYEAVIMSDEATIYEKLYKVYIHGKVHHASGEYVRGNVHTNTIEGFWSLFKRGVVGIYHFVSAKHLDKYIDEFEFRYNTKKSTEQNRFDFMLGKTEGYLSYKELIAKK
jgi:transposase-like protein